MITSRIEVAIPRMIAKSAAISLDPCHTRESLIIGVNCLEVRTTYDQRASCCAQSAINVRTVIVKMVGFMVGSMILNRIVLWEAPYFAASMVMIIQSL